MKSTRNWSAAPPEIIGLIADRLHTIEDYASFRGVCTSWRSAVLIQPHPDITSKTLPWIMFHQGIVSQNFWSLSVDKFYKFNLPENTNRVLTGSHYGWLVLSRPRHVEIFNPVTRISLPLPLLSTLEGHILDGSYFLNKVILATTGIHQFLVFIIFPGEGKVIFTRPGDIVWMTVNIPHRSYDDILHMDNAFYAVDTEGRLIHLEITDGSPVGVGVELALPRDDIGVGEGDVRTFYLVEILGQLYMVLKFKLRVDEYRSKHVLRVFKLDSETRKWDEVFTLGEYAVFVGCTTSFSLLVSKYPESRSSIYFMDRTFWHRRGSRNMGVFNLETKTSAALDPDYGVVHFFCTPFWFIPSYM